MRKKLLLYWYIPETGWEEIYNLHISNLKYYNNRFDDSEVIISVDDDTPTEHIKNTQDRILECLPNASFTMYKNDPIQREAKYFREEFALKMDQLDTDTAYFFVHNKGVSSRYVSQPVLECWINFMYFANLYNIQAIDEILRNPEVCSIGTFTVKDFKPFAFLKYRWHYSGTFFWIVPSRLYEHIVSTNEQIPYGDRYFAEGFLGSVIPYNSGKDVHLYGCFPSCLYCLEYVNRIPQDDLCAFQSVIQSF